MPGKESAQISLLSQCHECPLVATIAELNLPDAHIADLLEAGQLNIWEWNLLDDTVIDFGHAESLSKLAGYAHLRYEDRIKNFLTCVHPDDREYVKRQLEKTRVNFERYIAEFRIKLLNGNYEWVSARGRYVHDKNNVPIKLIGAWRFITEQKKIEELARRQRNVLAKLSRVYSMGELASTIAHEVSQPLLVINSYLTGGVRRLRECSIEKDELLDVMQTMMKQVELIGKTIQRIKNFVTQGELLREKTSIVGLIENAIHMVSYGLDAKVEIKLERSDNLPDIELDRAQVTQVFLNLITNAIEALQASETKEPQIRICIKQVDGSIEVQVIDNGPGISFDIGEEMFTPFLSTKKEGMGMGLAITRSIVEAHGGRIYAVNNLTQGATFVFSLPLHLDGI